MPTDAVDELLAELFGDTPTYDEVEILDLWSTDDPEDVEAILATVPSRR